MEFMIIISAQDDEEARELTELQALYKSQQEEVADLRYEGSLSKYGSIMILYEDVALR